MDWIVFDYAGVISLTPPDVGVLLPQTLGVAADRFWPVYWEHRPPYDLGEVTAAGFWRTVGEHLDVPVDADLVEVLVPLDLRTWGYTNEDTVAVLTELAGDGARLALLSNAPAELARLVDDRPWASLFRHRLFSADLRLAKPDPEIFRHLTERLGAAPGDVLFVDDREENVRAAEAFGIRALLFTDAASLRADLAHRPGPGRLSPAL
ncbi:MAG TPA: HAD family phosphatase [Thermomonospora sp.]|nr:HAD family phosphatase [Thermomonospora sp.]